MNTVAPYNVLYFGCWGQSGHQLWAPGHVRVPLEVERKLPWTRIDGALQPGSKDEDFYHSGPEPEGKAALHQKGDWTCIAFWDRSGDERHGSNSNFFVRGELTFEEVVRITQTHFPELWKRFPFEVICVYDNGHTVPETMTLEEKAADYARVVTSLKLITADRDRLKQKVADLEADRILGVKEPHG